MENSKLGSMGELDKKKRQHLQESIFKKPTKCSDKRHGIRRPDARGSDNQ